MAALYVQEMLVVQVSDHRKYILLTFSEAIFEALVSCPGTTMTVVNCQYHHDHRWIAQMVAMLYREGFYPRQLGLFVPRDQCYSMVDSAVCSWH